MDVEQREHVVSGFAFYSEKDAGLAEQERQKIAYLDKRIDHTDIQSVLAIYKKALEDRVFRTPVGLEYLRELQGELRARGEELGEEVPPIPLWTNFADVRTKTSPARRRIQSMPEDGGKKAGLHLSVIMNIVMIVAIIAMFVITLNSDQPNILNYERNLQNKYASWEQELTQREQTVREKERELHIENTGNTGTRAHANSPPCPLSALYYVYNRKVRVCMDRLKILVVDDESRMRKLVRDFLVKSNFEVLEAGDGEEALDIFYKDKDIALIILDVMMPKMDGWQVCREIRVNSQVPIIMLTARGDERDELQGFQLGVDEYISKPFSPKILVARVEAILRRTNQLGQDEALTCGGITVDKTAHRVIIDGKDVDLSYKEFELLTYFMENKGIALSREKILNNVWNYDYFGDARTIDTHVKKLRSKLGEEGNLIKTIWGMGYKMDETAE